MIELAFLKELTLIRKVNAKSTIFVAISIFKGLKFQPHICNGCHNLLMISMNLKDINILNIKGADYCCVTSGISKSEALNLMQNINLAENSRKL